MNKKVPDTKARSVPGGRRIQLKHGPLNRWYRLTNVAEKTSRHQAKTKNNFFNPNRTTPDLDNPHSAAREVERSCRSQSELTATVLFAGTRQGQHAEILRRDLADRRHVLIDRLQLETISC
jgi:hypothetical protein